VLQGQQAEMGNAIIAEAVAKGHQIEGAIEAPNNPNIGKTLRELGDHQLRYPNPKFRQIKGGRSKRRHLH